MNYAKFLLTTSVLASALSAQAAVAQSANATTAGSTKEALVLEEIIVTAERRFNTAQKTAAAISVRPGAEMVRQGRYELKNILEDVPGISGGASGSTNTSLAGGTDNPATRSGHPRDPVQLRRGRKRNLYIVCRSDLHRRCL